MPAETKTIEVMIGMYCRNLHKAGGILCDECSELLAYALLRIKKCHFGKDKPVCAKCPTHCYTPEMRKRIISLMRYSGPRMAHKHPVLALRHLIRARLNKPKRKYEIEREGV